MSAIRTESEAASTSLAESGLGVGPWSIVDRSPLRWVLGLGIFEVAFYLAYRYGMSFGQACASPFWFPDSVLLCALLLTPARQWWVFVLAALPIRLLVAVPPDVPTWFLLVTFAIDSAKGLVAATALRRFVFVRDSIFFETVRDFALFCLFAVLLVPATSAFGGAAARGLLGHDYWTAWEQWFLGDAMANLVVTPALLYWVFGAELRLAPLQKLRCLEGGLLAICLVLTGRLALSTVPGSIVYAEAYFYAPVPFLFWAAIRFGMPGASGAVMVITLLSIEAALDGRGPFTTQSPEDTALALQHFLLLRAVPAYVVAVLTEQAKRADLSLRESEGRFRNMADTAPVLIWMSDSDGLRRFFNRGWLGFVGHDIKGELSNGWIEAIHPEDVSHCLDTYRSCFDARRVFDAEYRLRRHDGEYRWVVERGVPRYGPDGGFVGYIGSAIDITDRKWVEEAQRNLAHTQRLAMMGELTATIAHEVNQPLCAILSNADAATQLLDSADPPLGEIREIIDDIRKDDLRADETLRRIRGLLRKREMQMKPIDLNDAVTDALRLAAADASRRRVQIGTDLERGLPLAFGDRACLQQVVLNLVLNGMDAMLGIPEAARRLTVRTQRTTDGGAEVAVTDHGSGIPADGLRRVFESFFTTKKEGMGLGLPIARSLIEAHEGRIWAENNSTGGATFRFTVRLATDAGAREVRSTDGQAAGNGRRIADADRAQSLFSGLQRSSVGERTK